MANPPSFCPSTIRSMTATGIVVLALTLVGCSERLVQSTVAPAVQGEPSTPTDDQMTRFDTHDTAELLRAEPGELDARDDAGEVTDRLLERYGDGSAGASSDEIFRELLNLAAADYRNVQQYIDEVGFGSSESSGVTAGTGHDPLSLMRAENTQLSAIVNDLEQHAQDGAIDTSGLYRAITTRSTEIREYLAGIPTESW